MHLNISEVFGPTVQGEGRHAGQLASFVRLGGCNLSCSWCDTPYTWDWSRFDRGVEVSKRTVEDVAALIDQRPGRVVISGGEPLLQAQGIAALMGHLPYRTFDLETNGTRPLGLTASGWSTVTVSPKVGPSAGQGHQTIEPTLIRDPLVDWKFVVAGPEDLEAADRFVAEHQLAAARVWVMPEGTDPQTVAERIPDLADQAIARSWNVTTRLHVAAWGDARGH